MVGTVNDPDPPLFNISPETLDALLLETRDSISGPGRAILVIMFNHTVPTKCGVCTDAPVSGEDQFSRDACRIWNGYSIGHTVPVVMCRMAPTPFTGILVLKLPWADDVGFCGQCGSIDHVACQ
jgi:hypothetical protein